MTDPTTLPPLPRFPTADFKKGWTHEGIADTDYYSREAVKELLRSYAEAVRAMERERAARIVELFVIPADAQPYANAIRAIASAIRGSDTAGRG